MRRPRIGRLVRVAPVLGVGLFFSLYTIAALSYPGGSYRDPNAPGFSFFYNYWCDLLHTIAKNGAPNPGHRFGLAALLVIVPTLGAFWHVVALHYESERRLVLATRSFGYASALLTLVLVTPLHDRAVELGGGLGLVAFGAALAGLKKAGHLRLALGGAAAVLLSLVCLFIWRTRVGIVLLAPLQKVAFAAFLGWVVVASLSRFSRDENR